MTISLETRFPASRIDLIFSPRGESWFDSFRSSLPVSNISKSYLSAIPFAKVPFPAPCIPNNIKSIFLGALNLPSKTFCNHALPLRHLFALIVRGLLRR